MKNLRDPVIYRILHASTTAPAGDWCRSIPMYDFTHGLVGRHRGDHPLALHPRVRGSSARSTTGFIETCSVPSRPRQIEFARLNLTYTVLSKRKLLQLVEGGHVEGWDDPACRRLSGLRRRGYHARRRSAPSATRDRGGQVQQHVVDIALLEHCLREILNRDAEAGAWRCSSPLKVVIENYPEDRVEELEAINNPEDVPEPARGKVPFSRELYIERDDFMEDPPKKFFRLAPGREVRLRYAYFITCVEVIKDEAGEVVELRCTYDPETRGGDAPDGRKVKGTMHWVSAAHARGGPRGAALRPPVARARSRSADFRKDDLTP